MNILQISSYDYAGGAEKVAFSLFNAYRNEGHNSTMAVGVKHSADKDIIEINNDAYRGAWSRAFKKAAAYSWRLPVSRNSMKKTETFFNKLSEPVRYIRSEAGYEEYSFPGIWHLLENIPVKPDIIHCHNLHGGYFDLRVLPWLSKKAPLLITMHDAWLLSGHCAHSLTCDRWKTGCGACPDLTLYPAIKKDNTHTNWKTKQDLYRNSRLYISTPCNWLMQKAGQSMMGEFMKGNRVVNNGIDTKVFNVAGKETAKKELGLKEDTFVILIVGNLVKQNRWKDYDALCRALLKISENKGGKNIVFIALGTSASNESILPDEIKGIEKIMIPKTEDSGMVARYYKAADVYMHPALADTFPNVILEAMACGTPVVATAICGIPEQVNSLDCAMKDDGVKGYDSNEATGILVPLKNDEAMSNAILHVMGNESLRNQMGHNAAERVRSHFTLEQQTQNYLEWYREIIDKEQNRA